MQVPDRTESVGKWLASPVATHEGSLVEIQAWVPAFERRPFELGQEGSSRTRANEQLDMIVRLPFRDDRESVPIGVVSKGYVLVQHYAVVEAAGSALKAAGIDPSDVRVHLTITRYGERMAISVFLPESFAFDPGDGHPMALRLECMNSVDGSVRLHAMMGWFRFVCGNGLIIGITQYRIRRRHSHDVDSEDIAAVLKSGLSECATERRNFERWRETPIELSMMNDWLETDVRRTWGVKAATRAFHIARSGYDVEAESQYRGATLASIRVRRTKAVPGAPARSSNLFDISQVLAWLAAGRGDLKEQMDWREQIPALLDSLVSGAVSRKKPDQQALLFDEWVR